MALTLPGDESQRIYFAIYKPFDGHDIDDAVAHIARFTANLQANAAVLKNVTGSWAAVFAVWKGASDGDDGSVNLPGAAELRSVVRVVEYAWFCLCSEAHREPSLPELSVGDIVSVRRIYSDHTKQEVLAYSCLAILKAYFNEIEGLLSATFYRSTDCKRIMGLGLWDSLESALAFVETCAVSRGEAYWKGLDAKMVKYDVCHVICHPAKKRGADFPREPSNWRRKRSGLAFERDLMEILQAIHRVNVLGRTARHEQTTVSKKWSTKLQLQRRILSNVGRLPNHLKLDSVTVPFF